MRWLHAWVMMRPMTKMLAAALCFVPLAVRAEQDGPAQTFHDDLLDRMTGHWRLRGTSAGGPVDHEVRVEWVLNHQFLRIHEKALAPSKSGVTYEVMAMLGQDNRSDRYVLHWIDVYGGRWSETLGYGKRDGNAVEFVFEYPDGPFRTAFIWDPAGKSWRWKMRQKSAAGEWKDFLDAVLQPAP